MQHSRGTLKERVVIAAERLRAAVLARSLEEWSEIELSLPQFRTVLLLSKGPKRMSEIAAHFGKGLSSVTSLIDRLVEKGLVERASDAEDRRVVLCRLSTRGQEEVDRFNRMGQMRLENLVQTASPAEIARMLDALDLLTNLITRAQAEAPRNAALMPSGRPATGSRN